MSTREREHVVVDAPRDADPSATQETAAPTKKAYRKPVLSKYEQLHGIGLGIY
jgi:hypothetical protein